MNTLRIMSVVGARPNFMKIAPFASAIEGFNDGGNSLSIEHCLVHTGQHYDADMSESFFKALGIPEPDIDLGIGSGSHAEQVGKTMIAFEKVVRQWCPDWIVVVGDVNATCACAITAAKEHVKLAHIEAGLRSFDNRMPEEINRLVTDRLSNLLFTTDEIADKNLLSEGSAGDRIKRVGNIMIDTLEKHRNEAEELDVADIVSRKMVRDTGYVTGASAGIADSPYATLTLHRPSNVDDPAILGRLVDFFVDRVAVQMPLVWTLHPRTRKQLSAFGLWEKVAGCRNLCLVEPLGYLELMRLNMSASVMLTDSGGLQEECCVLGTPCLTLRENTERPVTLREHGGLSELVGNDVEAIEKAFAQIHDMPKDPHRPPLWDGHTAERIVDVFAKL